MDYPRIDIGDSNLRIEGPKDDLRYIVLLGNTVDLFNIFAELKEIPEAKAILDKYGVEFHGFDEEGSNESHD